MAAFRITGIVLDAVSGNRFPALRIEAWDKDLLVDDLVGSSVSDADGHFRIDFDESYFRELFVDRRPDLLFRVFDGERLLGTTEPLKDVEPVDIAVLLEFDGVPGGVPGPNGTTPPEDVPAPPPGEWTDQVHDFLAGRKTEHDQEPRVVPVPRPLLRISYDSGPPAFEPVRLGHLLVVNEGNAPSFTCYVERLEAPEPVPAGDKQHVFERFPLASFKTVYRDVIALAPGENQEFPDPPVRIKRPEGTVTHRPHVVYDPIQYPKAEFVADFLANRPRRPKDPNPIKIRKGS